MLAGWQRGPFITGPFITACCQQTTHCDALDKAIAMTSLRFRLNTIFVKTLVMHISKASGCSTFKSLTTVKEAVSGFHSSSFTSSCQFIFMWASIPTGMDFSYPGCEAHQCRGITRLRIPSSLCHVFGLRTAISGGPGYSAGIPNLPTLQRSDEPSMKISGCGNIRFFSIASSDSKEQPQVRVRRAPQPNPALL